MWPGPGLRGSSLGNAEERWQDKARQSVKAVLVRHWVPGVGSQGGVKADSRHLAVFSALNSAPRGNSCTDTLELVDQSWLPPSLQFLFPLSQTPSQACLKFPSNLGAAGCVRLFQGFQVVGVGRTASLQVWK